MTLKDLTESKLAVIDMVHVVSLWSSDNYYKREHISESLSNSLTQSDYIVISFVRTHVSAFRKSIVDFLHDFNSDQL